MITPKRSENATTGNRSEPVIHPLRQWPWRHKHIENTLKNPNFTFCRTDINLIVEKDAVDYIGEILKYPLKKLSHELKHLSVRFLRTSKAEVQTALRLIFHDNLSHLALASGVHALSLFVMSMDKYKFSKSVRCLLSFSVGHFFRWLVDHNISKRVTDCSVVYLAAAFQCLTEELLTRTIQTKVTADSSKGKQKAGKEVPTTQVYQYYNILDWDGSWCPPCLNKESGPSTSGWVAGGKQDFVLTREVLKSVIQHDADLARVFGVEFARGVEVREDAPLPGIAQQAVTDSPNLEDSLGALDMTEYFEDCGCQHCTDIKSPLDLCCVHSLSVLRELVSKQQQLQHHQLQTYRRTHGNVTQPLSWSNNAFHSLLYYLNQHDESRTCNKITIREWIRVAGIYAAHHLSELIDEDDISQAAKFLLGIDYPPRRYGLEDPLCLSHKLNYASSFNSLPFKLLTCGRNDSIRQALSAIGPDGINSHIYQGMTPLMCAANAGDYNLVHLLLDADAHPNIAVPVPLDNTQVIPMENRRWTALSFAVNQGHTDIVKLLLSRGAAVEGSMNNPADITTETPLQLAAAAGDSSIVELLLEKGADPFLSSSIHSSGSTPRNRGGSNAIALAVAHGHVEVRHKLLQHQPSVKSNDMLSLQEILAEGYLFQNNRAHGIRLSRLRKLQEALYLACEHGYLNIALELRSIGVMWNLNFWTRCLETAYEEENLEIVRYLLNDYDCLRVDEFSNAFCKDGIVLLFEIFQNSKEEDIVMAACKMLQHCYGVFQWKPISNFSQHAAPEPRIDLNYVNNKEFSDVTFLVEDKMFYAHKIVIVTGSERFNAMLSKHFVEGSSAVVEIPDIKYSIFEIIIKYLYAGSVNCVDIKSSIVLDVLSAAHFFMLDELQFYCESLAAGSITKDNVITVYQKAKLYNAHDLVHSCLHFFLGFLPELIKKEDFVNLLESSDLCSVLQQQLSKRIQKRIKSRSMSINNPPLISN